MAQLTNPNATGGAGTHFEHRVGAFYLGLLLSRGVPPFLPTCVVKEVHLQSGHADYKTDDLLVVGQDWNGEAHRLITQVKRSFTLSANDEVCVATFTRAWEDFQAPARFTPSHDVIALIVGPGSGKLWKGLRNLLDCADAVLETTDFLHRLSHERYWGKTAQEYAATIRKILDGAQPAPLTDDQFWRFLRALDFGVFDLAMAGSVMEPLLLSRLADTGGGLEQANGTLGELVSLAGNKASRAKSYDYSSLPLYLRQRHNGKVVGQELLGRLRDHAAIVARGVKEQLGSAEQVVKLPRSELIAELLTLLEESRVVLVAGEAGTGKSAVAKIAFQQLERNGLALAFRAERFAQPHLDDVFTPLGGTFAELAKATAGFPRKLLWIESIERLLEKNESQAFTDLLAAVKEDPSWRLILTCRDYSAETIRNNVLGYMGTMAEPLVVPRLTDAELAEVGRQLPFLERPLGNPKLHRLLQNLFVLDKAVQIDWSKGSIPANERELRDRVWIDLVRREERGAEAMPARREEAFIQLAVGRAKALEPYIDCHALNPTVIQGLRQDGLVTALPGDDWMLAPAHDVLEDWAIMFWLDRLFNQHKNQRGSFFLEVDTFPAMRRAFRRWLTESLNSIPALADEFALQVIEDLSVPQHWRDDTVVAVLLSGEVCGFLQRNRAVWQKDNFRLLRRIVHLLRVACKGLPFWLRPGVAVPGTFLTAQGEAWGCVADILHAEIARWKSTDLPFLLGFLEDWSSAVSWFNVCPPGAEAVARICLHFLPNSQQNGWTYRENSAPARLAKVLLKIPGVVPKEIDELVRNMLPKTRWDPSDHSPPALIINFLHGYAAARDLPDLVFACLDQWLGFASRPNLRRSRHPLGQIEAEFGLPEHFSYNGYPPSAWRGPFANLLKLHSARTIDYIIRLLNESADTYAQGRGPGGKVDLRFPDGTQHEQWADARLWGMFCAPSSGPHILESILMALETWLLELGDAEDPTLAALLMDLLRRSNNVMITAVVTSVCRAFPLLAGDAALVVLTVPVFFRWERQRALNESGYISSQLAKLLPVFSAERDLLAQERETASKRLHRRIDLEGFVCSLQLTARQADVQSWIDAEQAMLPPPENQNEEIKLWRLLLHRIDRRRWIVTGKTSDGYLELGTDPLPSDIQEVVDRARPRTDRSSAQTALLNWGMGAFFPSAGRPVASDQWREQLGKAREFSEQSPAIEDEIGIKLEHASVAYVAAACVRDHCQELTEIERSWCVRLLCESVAHDADSTDLINIVSQNRIDATRPAALVLPSLLRQSLSASEQTQVENAVAIALTHTSEEVRSFAASGLAAYTWTHDRRRVLACIQAFAEEAQLSEKLHEAELRKDREQQRTWEEVAAEVRRQIRQRILQNCDPGLLTDIAIKLDGSFAQRPIRLILTILNGNPSDPLNRMFIAKMVQELVAIWKKQSRYSGGADEDRRQRNVELEFEVQRQACRIAVKLPLAQARIVLQPVVEATASMSREVGDFLGTLVGCLDASTNFDVFWAFWQGLVDQFLPGVSLARLANEHDDCQGLLLQLFLNLGWNGADIDWAPVHGQEQRIDTLLEKLPDAEAPFSNYIRYLHTVGGRSLPAAFPLIAKKLQSLPAGTELSADVILRCEVVLGHHVHSASGAVKRTPALREAILSILDNLVERGSSAAFRMRDDFVTPV